MAALCMKSGMKNGQRQKPTTNVLNDAALNSKNGVNSGVSQLLKDISALSGVKICRLERRGGLDGTVMGSTAGADFII